MAAGKVTLTMVKAAMAKIAKKYPQYVGHWDGWKPVIFTDKVVTKAGVAFQPGDKTYAKTKPFYGKTAYLVFSYRNMVDTELSHRPFKYI
jgi:hypothetical protein